MAEPMDPSGGSSEVRSEPGDTDDRPGDTGSQQAGNSSGGVRSARRVLGLVVPVSAIAAIAISLVALKIASDANRLAERDLELALSETRPDVFVEQPYAQRVDVRVVPRGSERLPSFPTIRTATFVAITTSSYPSPVVLMPLYGYFGGSSGSFNGGSWEGVVFQDRTFVRDESGEPVVDASGEYVWEYARPDLVFQAWADAILDATVSTADWVPSSTVWWVISVEYVDRNAESVSQYFWSRFSPAPLSRSAGDALFAYYRDALGDLSFPRQALLSLEELPSWDTLSRLVPDVAAHQLFRKACEELTASSPDEFLSCADAPSR